MTMRKTTQSGRTGLSRIDELADKINTIHSMVELHSTGTFDNYGKEINRVISWVVIPDHMWERATMMEYIQGIPMYQPNRVYKKIRS